MEALRQPGKKRMAGSDRGANTRPFHVTLVMAKKAPQGAFWPGGCNLTQLQNLSHHEEHHKSGKHLPKSSARRLASVLHSWSFRVSSVVAVIS